MRHEIKYICSEKQLFLIEQRLKTIMKKDVNQKGDSYRIRSLYFDTEDDRFLEESINGTDNRRKYRIRFYDLNEDFFRIERKDTVRNMKQKYSARVGKQDVDRVLSGDIIPESDDELIREIRTMQMSEGMHPVAIVDYRRIAYTYPDGNIRITLDKDISCSGRVKDFCDKNALLVPVLPYGRHILEVKYDGIMPGYISKMIDIGDLEQVSFSKYGYSRRVIKGNGRLDDGYEL